MRSTLALLFLTSACGGLVSGGPGEAGGRGGEGAGGSSAGNSFGGSSASGAAGGGFGGSAAGGNGHGGSAAGGFGGTAAGGAAAGGSGFGGSSNGGGAGASNGGSSGASSQVVCPNTTRGPALLPAGIIAGKGFCIDRTEVTEEQFDGFLRDVGDPSAAPDLLPAVCDFKQRFGPVNFRSSSILPMRRVDWCDAAAFCAWAGERLCQPVGEPVYDSAPITAQNSEWYYACSAGGTRRFPWGNDPQPLACNARCSDTCDRDLREKVGTRGVCQGGVEGVYDLGGNQREWVGWCDFRDPVTLHCRVQGGYWADPRREHESDDDAGDCQTNKSLHIVTTRDDIGFRCCADAATE